MSAITSDITPLTRMKIARNRTITAVKSTGSDIAAKPTSRKRIPLAISKVRLCWMSLFG